MEKTQIYEEALLHIRDNLGAVCEKRGKCEHRSCRDSLEAWKVASSALQKGKHLRPASDSDKADQQDNTQTTKLKWTKPKSSS